MFNNILSAHKKILVTGGSGMIGSSLIKSLLKNGNEVATVEHMRKVDIDHKNLRILKGNLCDKFICNNVTKDVDYVFCCCGAKRTISSGSTLDVVNNNLMMWTNLINEASVNQVEKFLFLSSATVYPYLKKIIVEEDSTLTLPHNANCYIGELYKYFEKVCGMYNDFTKMKTFVVRASSVYGPMDNFNIAEANVIPSLMHKVFLDNGVVEILGEGKEKRDFIYVDDLSRLMVNVMEQCLAGVFINIAYGKSFSINEIINKILDIFNKKIKIVHNNDKKLNSIPSVELSISKAKKSIDFSLDYSIDEGLRKTWEWFVDNNEKFKK